MTTTTTRPTTDHVGPTPDSSEPTPRTGGVGRSTDQPTDTGGRAVWIGIALSFAAAVGVVTIGLSGDGPDEDMASSADRVLVESSERFSPSTVTTDAGASSADRVLLQSRERLASSTVTTDSGASSADRVLLQSRERFASSAVTTDSGASSADRVLLQSHGGSGREDVSP